ncbi:hypothetical protein [Streptomyces virginiae]|uniref:hypothetical protein n=1 Tax=Streptomyces virginiae TaxID=1961 RepID=UPI0036F93250
MITRPQRRRPPTSTRSAPAHPARSTPPPSDSGTWHARTTVLVDRLRATVGAHPDVLPLTFTHRHRSPSVLRWGETVQQEHLGALSGAGTTAIAGLAADEYP